MTQQSDKKEVSPSQIFDDAAARKKLELECRFAYRRKHLLDDIPGYTQYNGPAYVPEEEKEADRARRMADRRRHLLDNIPGYKQYNGPP